MMSEQQRETFLQNYFSDPRSIAMLFIVCGFIATLTHLFNQIGLLINFGFSLGFGVPISVLESYFRTRKNPWPDMVINVVSVVLGCFIGIIGVYSFLVLGEYVPFGYFGPLLFVNFAIAMFFSASAFYIFWSRYRNQTLTMALQSEQLKAAENENLRQKAENRLLQAQMEPHFLFNTLANIQSLIDIDQAMAKRMIGDLSSMLRAAMNNSSRDGCSLSQELDLVRAYLNIQKVRFGDRLRVKESIDPMLLNVPVLPMLIQPLVENSVKHATEKAMSEITISLSVQVEDGQVQVCVQDDGDNSDGSTQGNGLSLNNIRQRLTNRYGDQASLNSRSTDTGWRTDIFFPMNVAEE